MNFFDSIHPVLCVWQSTCLNLFDLRPKRGWNSIYVIIKSLLSIFVVGMQIFSAYEKVSNIRIPTLPQFQLTKLIEISAEVILLELIPVVIFIESFVKRRQQKNFFMQCSLIDSILKEGIGVYLRYKQQRCQHIKHLLRWMATNLSIMVVYTLVVYKLTRRVDFSWFKEILPLFISTVHYCRVAICVDIVNQRYSLMSQFAATISTDDIRSSHRINVDGLIDDDTHATSRANQKLLLQLWRANKLVLLANNSISDMFRWSLFCGCVYDVARITITLRRFLNLWMQLSFLSFLPGFTLILMFLPLLQALPNINNILSLSCICGRTIEEVE